MHHRLWPSLGGSWTATDLIGREADFRFFVAFSLDGRIAEMGMGSSPSWVPSVSGPSGEEDDAVVF
jgi:hypothetical protein